MISVRNASKLYRIYDKPSGRLKEILLRGRRKYHRDFWALEDVSLEVGTGEAVGVIGRNGAGKTTLLQIIAGVLQPTRGKVSVEGRVTALLELGSGFNPEYTGRENILLSGQILGFSEEEMRRRMDVIVRFAELERFIDQPVKTYSTGMLMRLAFASAIHVDPDVLIVDEALSVGDVYFQRKSLDRMEYFRKAGKTVLFVSHEPTLVQRFCARALWLEQGRVAMVGDAKEVVTSYQAFCARLEEERLREAARNWGHSFARTRRYIARVEADWLALGQRQDQIHRRRDDQFARRAGVDPQDRRRSDHPPARRGRRQLLGAGLRRRHASLRRRLRRQRQ
jgi:teichoic acid transport system ATP-binding protein